MVKLRHILWTKNYPCTASFFAQKLDREQQIKKKRFLFPPLHFLSTPCIPWQTLATKGIASVTLCTSRNAPPRAMCDMKRNGCTWMVSTLKLVMRKMNFSRKKRIKKHTCKPKRNETKNILTIKRGKEKTHLEFFHQSALRIGNWAYARAPNNYTLKCPQPPPPPPGIGTGTWGSKEKSSNYVKQS